MIFFYNHFKISQSVHYIDNVIVPITCTVSYDKMYKFKKVTLLKFFIECNLDFL